MSKEDREMVVKETCVGLETITGTKRIKEEKIKEGKNGKRKI